MKGTQVKARYPSESSKPSKLLPPWVWLTKLAVWGGVLSLTSLGVSPVSLALSIKDVPNPRSENGGWVTDMADLLKPTTEADLNRQISNLEAQNGDEIAVVTVPETAPAATPKDFATELFNYWKIGKQGQDNGVLVLISKADRRVEIETGYGVEGILPDAKVGNIISQEMTPRFKQANYDGGTLAGTTRLIQALENETASVSEGPPPDQLESGAANPWLLSFLGLAGLASAGIAGVAFNRHRAARRPIQINPTGFSRIATLGKKHEMKRPALCCDCQQPMEKLELSVCESYLSKPQQVAQKLGSVNFIGWQCPRCQPVLNGAGSIHLRAYDQNERRFLSCPTCQELTVVQTKKTLEPATQFQEGKCLVTDTCHCCSYSQKREETIPRLPPPPPPSSTTSGFYGGGGFSGGSSGGSFGGGSSGGGGAGGSW